MKYIEVICFAALELICATSASIARDAGYTIIFEGKCGVTLNNEDDLISCDSELYYTLNQSKRTAQITFSVQEKSFVLIGKGDRQPNPENLYQSIQKVIINSGKKIVAQSEGWEGECQLNLNRDASEFHFVNCIVYHRSGGLSIELKFEDIKSFTRKSL